MLKQILEEIKKSNPITIFRHQLADMDAMGSQLGLSTWIKETYPEKEVYNVGFPSPVSEKFEHSIDEVSDEIIASSLAIVLDTSNASRVSDPRFQLAKRKIRIDHHVNQIQISSKAAQYFYCGLIADNIRFSISNVRKETFEAAGYLIECGANVLKANELNFSISMSDYQYENMVLNRSVRKENCLYYIMETEDYIPYQSYENAKDKVYVLSGINEIEIWALFTHMKDSNLYSCSLRSKQKNIRDIASSFNGGGHECACGIKNLTIEQVYEIIEQIAQRSK